MSQRRISAVTACINASGSFYHQRLATNALAERGGDLGYKVESSVQGNDRLMHGEMNPLNGDITELSHMG